MTALVVGVYSRLMRLYPRAVREADGADIVVTFAERLRATRAEPGRLATVWFVAREYGSLVTYAVREHMRSRFGHGPTAAGVATPTGSSVADVWNGLVREIAYATRRLLRSPTFTLVGALTLALGIGATTAVFTVVDGVMIRALPYPDAHELVSLDHGASGLNVERGLDMTTGLYLHYGRSNRTFSGMAVWDERLASLTGDGEPARVSTARMTPDAPSVLGVDTRLGRWFDPNDVEAGNSHVVVLGHDLWSVRYGSDPDMVGRSITIDGVPFEVLGVAGPSLAFPDTDTDLWIPMVVDPEQQALGSFSVRGVGRLRRGIRPEEAQADLARLVPLIPDALPEGNAARSTVDDAKVYPLVVPLRDQLVGGVRQTLWILLGSAAFVLLIAGANVSNLFLVRADSRIGEVKLRRALGAGQRQMVASSLSESLLLAGLGGVIGLALAIGGVRALVAFGPEGLPRLHEVDVDGRALVMTLLLSLVAGLVFGCVPLVRGWVAGTSALTRGSRSAGGTPRERVRNSLVVGQVAIALVLLAGSGLMARSYWNLSRIDPGFRASGVLSFELGLPPSTYAQRSDAVALHRQLLDRLEGLPGVTSVGAGTCLPLCGSWAGNPLDVEGVVVEPGTVAPVVATRRVSAGYLESLRIPLLAGRTLERTDQEQRTGAAVVSAELVERYWPGEDPLGRRLNFSGYGADSTWYTVVGVVGDVPVRELTDDPGPALYLPLLHTDGDRGPGPHTLSYVVRASVPPLDLLPAVRREVAAMDDALPVAGVRTLERMVADAGASTAFLMALLAIAATVALLLGSVGIYGVVSYAVSRRTSEFGVRIALGARERDVRRLVLDQGARLALIGVAVGVAGSLALTRALRTLLYGVAPSDPATLAFVAVLLMAIALLAAYLPARRASRVAPVEALRAD